MKNSISNKIIAIVLSLSMALSIIPSFSVPFFAEGEIDYGANIGAVAEWDTTSVLLAAAPSGESGSDVVNGISPAQLPSKISITDYYNDGANIWYKLDAAPAMNGRNLTQIIIGLMRTALL